MTNNYLTGYAKIADITHAMLIASQHADWDLLEKLEADCAAEVALMSKKDSAKPMTSDELEMNIYHIQKILEYDREIRKLLEPWMVKLNNMMHGSINQSKLNQAYGITKH
jgi:flagellar protein FliT